MNGLSEKEKLIKRIRIAKIGENNKKSLDKIRGKEYIMECIC